MVFGMAEQEENPGRRPPAGAVSARDLVEAARNGMEYRPDASGRHWRLLRRSSYPVVRLDPRELDSPDARAFAEGLPGCGAAPASPASPRRPSRRSARPRRPAA